MTKKNVLYTDAHRSMTFHFMPSNNGKIYKCEAEGHYPLKTFTVINNQLGFNLQGCECPHKCTG
jgi:hypothetical protein